MSSAVLELQSAITESNCDIVNVLRKAHIIAVKLGLHEFDQWITNELNGYTDPGSVPEYRLVHGELKLFNPYRGWIPAIIPDTELDKIICEKKIQNSISGIITLCKDNKELTSPFTGSTLRELNRIFDFPTTTNYALFISISAAKDIIQKVKNTVLEWTIRLDKEGILGENMRFTKEETESAKSIPQQVNYYYGTVVNGNANNSPIVTGNNNNINFNYEKALCDVAEIRHSIESDGLTASDKEQAFELLEEISRKIEGKKKPGIIKSALIGLKDFLLETGANVAVALITAKIQGLF